MLDDVESSEDGYEADVSDGSDRDDLGIPSVRQHVIKKDRHNSCTSDLKEGNSQPVTASSSVETPTSRTRPLREAAKRSMSYADVVKKPSYASPQQKNIQQNKEKKGKDLTIKNTSVPEKKRSVADSNVEVTPKKTKVDKEEYEIEKIVGHDTKMDGLNEIIAYEVKWINYPSSDNTSSYVRAFNSIWCLLQYHMEFAHEEAIRNVGVGLCIVHQWQKEQVIFCNDDAMFLHIVKLAKNNGWMYMTNFLDGTKYDDQTRTARILRYEYQANRLCAFHGLHPTITIENTEDDDLPVPLKSLVGGLLEYDYNVKNGEEVDIWFLDDQCLHSRMVDAVERFQHTFKKPVPEENSTVGRNSRRRIPVYKPLTEEEIKNGRRKQLRLVRKTDRKWSLRVDEENIEEGEVIIPLCGVLREVEHATRCMLDDGEVIALSCFTKLSNTYCLDQREYFGFDTYIRHSCVPNCFIDLVSVRERKEDLVPVVKAKKTLSRDDELTLDLYSGLIQKAGSWSDHIKYIGRSNRDHLYCMCGYDECRGMLWTEALKKGGSYKWPKSKRLHHHQNKFEGRLIAGNNEQIMDDFDKAVAARQTERDSSKLGVITNNGIDLEVIYEPLDSNTGHSLVNDDERLTKCDSFIDNGEDAMNIEVNSGNGLKYFEVIDVDSGSDMDCQDLMIDNVRVKDQSVSIYVQNISEQDESANTSVFDQPRDFDDNGDHEDQTVHNTDTAPMLNENSSVDLPSPNEIIGDMPMDISISEFISSKEKEKSDKELRSALANDMLVNEEENKASRSMSFQSIAADIMNVEASKYDIIRDLFLYPRMSNVNKIHSTSSVNNTSNAIH